MLAATITRGNSGALDGVVVGRERYAAFGERRRGEAPATTDFLYTAQRFNANVGLYHYSDGKSAGRYYDPVLARFVMADPIIPGGGQGLNRYSYTFNNPIKYTDPTGHCPMCVTAGIGALVGGGIAYGSQVIANISRDGVSGQAFADVNWTTVGAGVVAGAVGGATFGVGTAVMGTGFAATVTSGAISGAVAGQAGRATENVLNGREVTAGLGNTTDIALDAAGGAAGGAVGYGIAKTVGYLANRGTSSYLAVETPYGPAEQALTVEALQARASVAGGARVYRIGTLGQSAGPEGQFWALENPLTSSGFAGRYGIPPQNIANADFIEYGFLKPGAQFVTRMAPRVGSNPGGGIEVVVRPFDVWLEGFYMP